MSARRPHYLLFSQADLRGSARRWSFVLQSVEGAEKLRAAESETDANGERIELLSVVRGLEALPTPSRVTLITESDYVRRGIRFGLDEWRANNWQWERFGEMVPVKNLDLWRRIDRALTYHDVEIKRWRVDAAHSLQPKQASRKTRKALQVATVIHEETWSEEYSESNEIEPLASERLQTVDQSDSLSESIELETEMSREFVAAPQTNRVSRNCILFLKRKIRIAQFRFIARLKELAESAIWFAQQIGTPLIARPWNDYKNEGRLLDSSSKQNRDHSF